LIVPAAIGTLYNTSVIGKLLVGWAIGVFASSMGLSCSYLWDLPPGATIVCVFGATLMLAALLKPLILNSKRLQVFAKALSIIQATVLGLVLVSGIWLTVNPDADHPLLNLLETYQPAVKSLFLSPEEQQIMTQAVSGAMHVRLAAEQLAVMERDSRWQGDELTDEELRRLSSYTLTFQEMEKGEQFVQRELRHKIRERQRWVLGVPLIFLALGWLIVLGLLS